MKTLLTKSSLPSSYTGTLPASATTRGGGVFLPGEEVWEIREGTASVKINFSSYPELDPEFKLSLKAALLWCAQNKSIKHLSNMHYRTKALLLFKADAKSEVISEITDIDLLNYRASLDKSREWYLSALSGFLKKWKDLGLLGVTEAASSLLQQMTLKGNEKGAATATMDPIQGPLTSIELEALQGKLNEEYANGAVGLSDFVLCWLVMVLGMRPTQYAALKVKDLVLLHGQESVPTYSLRMPRAKGRSSNPRGEFRERMLSPELGRLVELYVAQVTREFSVILDNPGEAPLFTAQFREDAIEGYQYHQTSSQIGSRITKVLKRLDVRSERTGKTIHATAKRFRETVGTRAAEEGHGELVIAELLDHVDTQNVGVYVGTTPAIVGRIDRAVAMRMAPMAQAFAGKLIKGRSEATRQLGEFNQVRAPLITGSLSEIASCGSNGFCGFLKPIACYTCANFEPWLDGPHNEVLQYLLDERDRLGLEGDLRIASINDRTILAVAEVIQLCDGAKDVRNLPNV